MSHIYFDIPIEPLPEGQSPVKHLKELGCVTVKLTPSVSVMVTTAAEAQELEMRFAAARHYLTDEPVLPAGDLDDAGDDITDALVPDVVPDPTVTAATGAVPAVAAVDVPADALVPDVAGERRTGLEPANSAGTLAFASGHSYSPPATPDSNTAPAALAYQPNPVCGICGTTDPVLDVVTNSRAAGWRECRDLHACGDRVIAAAKATFVEVAK